MAQAKNKLGMTYEKDENGKDILLREDKAQVMMEWEKPYMEACITTLNPKGDVLEIGFGLGYSANAIQKHNVKSHTILEPDATVLTKAKEWAKKHPNVKLVEGTWQDKLKSLGKFDAIFFDDYTPLTKDEAEKLQQETESYDDVVEEMDSLKDQIDKTLQLFANVKFSDQDLNQFIEQVIHRPNTPIQDVKGFLDRLVKQGNITEQQKDKAVKQLDKEIKTWQKETNQSQPIISPLSDATEDRLIVFITECLDNHMKPGSRLSCYCSFPESKKDDPNFKKILSRKDVNYSEKWIPVTVPENCTYYKGNQALIMVIEKR